MNDIKEILLGIPHVRDAILNEAYKRDGSDKETLDQVLNEIVTRVHTTDLKKTRRKVEEELRHNPVLTYVVGAQTGIIKDPVIR
jgi:CRISPR/Cas system CSM-associated protein Csm2 small subunit